MKKIIRIGAGAAWWGDRVEPAQLNAEKGQLDYLCFETMAEATVSAAQVRARRDPSFEGYDTYLDDRMKAVLPACMKQEPKSLVIKVGSILMRPHSELFIGCNTLVIRA